MIVMKRNVFLVSVAILVFALMIPVNQLWAKSTNLTFKDTNGNLISSTDLKVGIPYIIEHEFKGAAATGKFSGILKITNVDTGIVKELSSKDLSTYKSSVTYEWQPLREGIYDLRSSIFLESDGTNPVSTASIQAKVSSWVQMTPFTIKIEPRGLTISDETRQVLVLNKGESKILQITVTNLGNIADTFTLLMPELNQEGALSRSIKAKLEPEQISVEPNSKASVLLHINVNEEPDLGFSTMGIVAKSSNWGSIGTRFYVVINNENYGDFIDSIGRLSDRCPPPTKIGESFRNRVAELSDAQALAEYTIFAPTSLPDQYHLRIIDNSFDNTHLLYSTQDISEDDYGCTFFRSTLFLRIFFQPLNPNVKLEEWIISWVGQQPAQEIIVNGVHGVAEEHLFREDSQGNKVPPFSAIILFAKDSWIWLQGTLSLEELLNVARSLTPLSELTEQELTNYYTYCHSEDAFAFTDAFKVKTKDVQVENAYEKYKHALVNEKYFIRNTLCNDDYDEQQFSYIVKVSDEYGITTYLNWTDGKLLPRSFLTEDLSWVPDRAGKYTVKVYVWDDALSPNKVVNAYREENILVVKNSLLSKTKIEYLNVFSDFMLDNNEKGSVTGILKDISGEGIPNKSISIFLNGTKVGTTSTETNGCFYFNRWSPEVNEMLKNTNAEKINARFRVVFEGTENYSRSIAKSDNVIFSNSPTSLYHTVVKFQNQITDKISLRAGENVTIDVEVKALSSESEVWSMNVYLDPNNWPCGVRSSVGEVPKVTVDATGKTSFIILADPDVRPGKYFLGLISSGISLDRMSTIESKLQLLELTIT